MNNFSVTARANEFSSYFRSQTAYAPLIILFFSLFSAWSQHLVNTWYLDIFRASQAWVYAAFVIAGLFGVLFAFVTYASFGDLFRGLTRSCALGLAVYLAVEPPDVTLVYPEAAWRLEFLEFVYPLAIAFAIAGIWRPSFIFLPATYAISIRYMSEDIFGIQGGTLDIRYLVEMCQYLSLSSVVLLLLSRALPDNADTAGKLGWARCLLRDRALEVCIAFNAIAFHFGNYFWSGFAKLAHGPSVTTWALENPTHNVVPVALEKGVLIFGHWDWATDFMYQLFSSTTVYANIFVLATQFLAIAAIFSRRLIIWFSLFYDILHIALYVLNGLFFWPWVWTNVAILIGVRKLDSTPVVSIAKISCFLVIVLGGITGFARFAHLAWFITPDLKSPYYEVKSPEGDWLKVPLSFYGSQLYQISHGAIDRSVQPGHYTPSNWGAVPYEEYLRRKGCQAPVPPAESRLESDAERGRREHIITTFIRERHKQILERVDDKGRYNPYLRSHHHPSNPLLYSEFNRLDFRKVEEYRFVVQSVCLSIEEGKLQRRVLNEYKINVDVR